MNIKHDRNKVLQTATSLFCERGYSALGVNEILEQTGMTKGAFYNAFKSKEAFLLETLSLYSEKNNVRLSDRLGSRDGLKSIELLEQFYMDMLDMQDSINHKGCLVNSMMTELSGTNLNISNAINTHFETILQNLVPTIRKAQNEGDLTNNISAEKIAEILHSSFYGILNRLKSKRNTESSKSLFQILLNTFKQMNK